MEVTDVRVIPVSGKRERLLAVCHVVFDNSLVVRDIRLFRTRTEKIIAEFPAFDHTDRCPKCRHKNSIKYRYCTWCGIKLGTDRVAKDPQTGKKILNYDIAHPLDVKTRDVITSKLLEEYNKKMAQTQPPQEPAEK
jgi:DNA-binding cell septation regulator SpoVG